MSEMTQKFIGSFVRALLLIIVPVLTENGIWTPEEGTEFTAWIITGVVSLVWSLWAKYKDVILLKLAASMPPTTVEEVKEKSKDPVVVRNLIGMFLVVMASFLGSAACATRGDVQVSPEGTLALRANQLVQTLRTLTTPPGTSPIEQLVASKTLTVSQAVEVAEGIKQSMVYAQDLATVLRVVDEAKTAAERTAGLQRASVLVQQIRTSLMHATLSIETENGRKAVMAVLDTALAVLMTVGTIFPAVQ